MIKVTIAELLNSQGALARLMAQPVAARLSFALARVLRGVNTELETFNSTRLELCKKHGTLQEGRQSYEFEGDSRAAFEAEYAELLKGDVQLPFDAIPIEALELVAIPAADAHSLSWLVAE